MINYCFILLLLFFVRKDLYSFDSPHKYKNTSIHIYIFTMSNLFWLRLLQIKLHCSIARRHSMNSKSYQPTKLINYFLKKKMILNYCFFLRQHYLFLFLSSLNYLCSTNLFFFFVKFYYVSNK